jgi:hypothetical protein
LLGDLDDADPFGKLGSRTSKALPDLSMPRDEVAITLDLILGALQPTRTRVRIIERSNSAKAP